MAVYDTMNLKNKGGAVPTYQSNVGQSVYSPGMGRTGRLQSDAQILQQTGAVIDKNAELQRQAGEKLANAGEKMANAVMSYYDKYNEAKASELATKYRLSVQGLLHNDEGTGLMQLQQEGAKGAGDKFKEGANEQMEGLLDGYSEDIKARFYAKVNEYNVSQWGQVQQHEASEFKKWEINTAEAEAKNFGDLAVQSSDNPELMANYLAQSADSYKRAYENAGYSGEALARKVMEHTSKNISNAIKKTIKNDVNRAEAMLKGAEKYMTATDANDVQNSITSQRNVLETRALRAENAARERRAREDKKFYAEIKTPMKDAMAVAWNGGETESAMQIYDQLKQHGFYEEAEEFKSNIDTAIETRDTCARFSTMSIPEAQGELVKMAYNFSQNLDVNGKKMTTSAEITKMKTVISSLQSALNERSNARDSDVAAYAQRKDNPTFNPVPLPDGSVTYREYYDAMLASQEKDGVQEHKQALYTKEEVKKVKAELENSSAPYTYLMQKISGLSQKAQQTIIRQLEKEKIDMKGMGLLATIDTRTANELYNWVSGLNKPENRQLRDAVLETQNTKVKDILNAVLTDKNRNTMLSSFPVPQQAVILDTVKDLASMYVVKKGMDETTAVEEAWKKIGGKYAGVTINGASVRVPISGTSNSKDEADIFKFNLQKSIDEFYANPTSEEFQYIFGGVNPEVLPRVVENKRRNTGVANDGKGGYILTDLITGMPMTVGKGTKKRAIKIQKSNEELSMDSRQQIMETGIQIGE